MLLGYGVDLTLHEIARRLVEAHGCRVDIWTPTSDKTYTAAPYDLRELIVFGAPVNRALPLLELNAWRALKRLRQRLAREGLRYDVVIAATHPYYGAGRALGVPCVFFNFGNVPTAGFSWRGKLNWMWLDFSERVLHKPQAARVVSISQFLHEQQSSRVRQRGTVIHLGGDHYYPATADAGQHFRERYQLTSNDILVGYCGRLHRDHPPYKGTREILALGRRITQAEPRARLVLCGIGSPADVEWIQSEGAIAAANLPPSDMPGFYAALDLYVCASHWEGFNLPIVEAAWHGVPTVAYDAGAHREHVTAVLVPDGHSEQLYTETLHLVRDTASRRKLGQQTQAKAQQFSWDRTAAAFAQVLREVVH